MTVGTESIDTTVAGSGGCDADTHSADEGAKASDQAHVATAVRATILELMKYGLLEEASKPNLYRNALLHRDEVDRVLGWLELALRIDDIRGLAFVIVAAAPDRDDDEWSHPLVRRQRLTLEQSLLVAILRQQFVAHEVEAGVGAGNALISLDDLLPHLQAFLGDLGSDAQERKRLLTLLEQLKGHGIVSDIDQQERVTIRPIIAHLANPESLTNLVRALREAANNGDLSPILVEGADE
ncbi:MAG: hypothetical protein RL684_446 [Pseudomonadota bacterium]|jgi:hypothetical protein